MSVLHSDLEVDMVQALGPLDGSFNHRNSFCACSDTKNLSKSLVEIVCALPVGIYMFSEALCGIFGHPCGSFEAHEEVLTC